VRRPTGVALWMSDRLTQLAGGQAGQVKIDLLNAAQALRGGAPQGDTKVEATITVYAGPTGLDVGQLKDEIYNGITAAIKEANRRYTTPVSPQLGGAYSVAP
jgi:hypothetical protein